MRSRPHALTQWFENGATRTQDHRLGRGQFVVAGLQGTGQDGLDLVRGRGVTLEEVTMLGDSKGVGRGAAGQGEHRVEKTGRR